MTQSGARYRLELMGAFCLYGPDGARIDIASRKGMALMAMLAMASRGERTRSWLQDRLWGSRQRPQAQQSLRRELGNLRHLLPANDQELITAGYERVRLDVRRCSVDALEILTGAVPRTGTHRTGEFLEGFDIPGEDGFEAWLRELRQFLSSHCEGQSASAGGPRPQAAPEAPKPTLAMLPAPRAMADSGESEALRLIHEELVDRIARLRWLTLIAPAVVEALRKGSGDPAAISAAVEARYLLDVTGGRSAGVGELWCTLTETSSWRTMLSKRVPVAPQADLGTACRDIVSAIDAIIDTAEQQRAVDKRIEALQGSDRIWRARWHLERLTRRDAEIAQQLIDSVLADQPDSPEALLQAGFCKAWSIWSGRRPEADMFELRRLALRAVAADKFDARGHMLVGMAETWLRHPDRACLALHEALELNPSLCQAYMQLGSALYLADNAEAAIEPMETALALNPHDTQVFCVLAERGMVRLMLGDQAGAVESADLALLRRPGYWYAHVIKINALVRLGEVARSKRAYAELRRVKPSFTADFIDWLPFPDPKWPQFLRDGLEVAGGD